MTVKFYMRRVVNKLLTDGISANDVCRAHFLPPRFLVGVFAGSSSSFFSSISAQNLFHQLVNDSSVTGVPSARRLRTANSSCSASVISSIVFWASNCCAAWACVFVLNRGDDFVSYDI